MTSKIGKSKKEVSSFTRLNVMEGVQKLKVHFITQVITQPAYN